MLTFRTACTVLALWSTLATAVGTPPMTTTPASPSRDAAWSWPLTPEPRVLARFDPPEKSWLPGHRGVDLTSRQGQEVRAPADGTVTYSGSISGRGVLTIEHADGLRTTYEPIADAPPRGTAVKRSQVIGVIGGATHCGTQCLHWGAYRPGTPEAARPEKVYEDPLLRVGKDTRPSILYPRDG
jgi:murein DD-endopeptidase MepM/ murein hydrolase activator NlpD